MSKPTPGPWVATHKGGSNFALQAFEFRSAGAYPIFSKSAAAIDGAIVYCSPEDAALISAAPDLLEALKDLLRAVEGTAGGHLYEDFLEGTVVGKARAAIAKATGRAT